MASQSQPVHDSWTPGFRVRASSAGVKATRAMTNPTRLFARNIAALRKIDLIWLTRDTHWLDGDRKYIVEMPQTHHDLCTFRNRSCRAHEEAARKSPALHGRLNGNVTLVKTGAQTLLATVRLAGARHAAATVQLRRESAKKGLLNKKYRARSKRVRSTARVLAYLGSQADIDLALSSLGNFLSSRSYVEQALRHGAKAKQNFHTSYDPQRLEGRRTSIIDCYDLAGDKGSPERVYYAKHPQRISRGWAQRALKAS